MDRSTLLTNLKRHWNDRSWWREIGVPYAVRTAVVQPYFRYLGREEGVAVVDEDWDNLLLLDACRYDMFREHNTVEGELSARVSRGSNTEEFLRRNFGEGRFDDVVYVTANPQVNVRLDAPFHAVVSVWKDAWDDDLNTVLPEAMVDATLDAAERYPDKRIVSHFVQPHYPFVGEFGRTLFEDQAGIELSRRLATGDTAASDHLNVWDLLQRGKVSERDVWDAYCENLRIVLPHVQRLVDELSGRTVVTSDHGNLVGEYPSPCPVPLKMYGHPPGVYAESLVKVPWLVVDGERRRTVVAEANPTRGDDDSDDEATERLRDLGYLD
ncbi:hypothetical protein SAMN04487948_101208 [Halogranum amylolyticum]|uniref:PglZ domain-containing protein n=1 Tax=Halogranum amylolyticum TaxID=660520 RepID=A0A1H8MZG2_9EURY|nr:hypothetical protein [Halogranum amylolyticum]SEO22771.1 hypothetical protein SAMN04487948_101208 [Halogranum amylolyticum]